MPILTVRCTELELTALKANAKIAKVPVATLVRRALGWEIAGQPGKALEPLDADFETRALREGNRARDRRLHEVLEKSNG